MKFLRISVKKYSRSSARAFVIRYQNIRIKIHKFAIFDFVSLTSISHLSYQAFEKKMKSHDSISFHVEYRQMQSSSSFQTPNTMSQSALNKYSWISNSLFENAIRKEFGEFERFTIFMTSLEELQEVTDREQNFWCNIIKVLVNYTSLSVPKYLKTFELSYH